MADILQDHGVRMRQVQLVARCSYATLCTLYLDVHDHGPPSINKINNVISNTTLYHFNTSNY
jgi:hypothetical protein